MESQENCGQPERGLPIGVSLSFALDECPEADAEGYPLCGSRSVDLSFTDVSEQRKCNYRGCFQGYFERGRTMRSKAEPPILIVPLNQRNILNKGECFVSEQAKKGGTVLAAFGVFSIDVELRCPIGAVDSRASIHVKDKLMMRAYLHYPWITATVTMIFACVAASGDTFSVSLIPSSGNIGGASGSLIGWGYSITNDSSTDWLDVLAVNGGLFQHATLDINDYFDYPIVAPDTTVTVNFSPASGAGFGTGLAALRWDSSAPVGFVDGGNFDISACWANSNGGCSSSAPDALISYTATVTPATQTPEPSGALMFEWAALLLVVPVSIRNRRQVSG